MNIEKPGVGRPLLGPAKTHNIYTILALLCCQRNGEEQVPIKIKLIFEGQIYLILKLKLFNGTQFGQDQLSKAY